MWNIPVGAIFMSEALAVEGDVRETLAEIAKDEYYVFSQPFRAINDRGETASPHTDWVVAGRHHEMGYFLLPCCCEPIEDEVMFPVEYEILGVGVVGPVNVMSYGQWRQPEELAALLDCWLSSVVSEDIPRLRREVRRLFLGE